MTAEQSEGLEIDARRERITSLVTSQQFASVQELSDRFGVSLVTIRNDIDALSRENKGLRRVRGGILSGQIPYAETPYEARSRNRADDKAAIGAAAAAMIGSNDTLLLDVGTTAMAIADALVRRTDLANVTIVTNGLNIAKALEAAYPRIQTVVTGGTLRPLQHSLVDPMATAILERIRVGVFFLGCNGIEAGFGISTTNFPEAAMKTAMMRAAARVIVTADGSKFGRSTLAQICAVDAVDMILTAGRGDPQTIAAIRDLGVEVRDAGGPN